MADSFFSRSRPFVIAEIGGNHEGDVSYGWKLLREAIRSPADAIKFQTYHADTMVSPVEGRARYEHFKKFELSYDIFRAYAAEIAASGKIFMSSLWDAGAVAALDPLIGVHKVGSGDLTNLPLLRVLLGTNKPIILSTAMATLEEVRYIVQFIAEHSPSLLAHRNLALLHCVAMYGDPLDRFANLGAIKILQQEFPDIPIGYSDHTVGMHACEVASAMGASVIEKHFTDDKTRTFRDHQISGTVADFSSFDQYLTGFTTLMGTSKKEPVPGIETPERIQEFRRAVYLRCDGKAGQIITEEDITTLRPNVGIDAREFFRVLGKRLVRDVPAFHRMSWNDLE